MHQYVNGGIYSQLGDYIYNISPPLREPESTIEYALQPVYHSLSSSDECTKAGVFFKRCE